MVVRDENFPVFPVGKADGMVLKVAIGIDRFLVTEPSIDIGTGIRRVMYDSKNTAVGQCRPCNLSIPCAAISAFGKREAVFGEIPDNAISASRSTEFFEEGGYGIPDFFIRIHDDLSIGVIDIPHR